MSFPNLWGQFDSDIPHQSNSIIVNIIIGLGAGAATDEIFLIHWKSHSTDNRIKFLKEVATSSLEYDGESTWRSLDLWW